MRFMKSIFAVTLLCACGFAVSIGLTSSVAAGTDSVADKVYPMSYRLGDLPVWSRDGGTFDPAILMAYMKASVDPTAWGAGSTMAAFAEQSSLVVSTTSQNHNAIHDLLKGLRESEPN